MKSKEEILKRNTESIAKCNVKYNVTHQGILNAMEEYATQCQDKKYTEEDLMSAFNAGINNDYGNGSSFDQWLNALNKQD